MNQRRSTLATRLKNRQTWAAQMQDKRQNSSKSIAQNPRPATSKAPGQAFVAKSEACQAAANLARLKDGGQRQQPDRGQDHH